MPLRADTLLALFVVLTLLVAAVGVASLRARETLRLISAATPGPDGPGRDAAGPVPALTSRQLPAGTRAWLTAVITGAMAMALVLAIAVGVLRVAMAVPPPGGQVMRPVAPVPAAAAVSMGTSSSGDTDATTRRTSAGPATPWTLQSWVALPSRLADQGVATVIDAAARSNVLTRGDGSIPPVLRGAGWVHVGDPDSSRGYLFDAYQGRPRATSKMFAVTSPAGTRQLFIHHLAAGEMVNNSFAAMSPDGRWLVSGEWRTVRRLLVFPAPQLNPTASDPTRDLPLAGTLTLQQPVRDVQGCAFLDPVSLACSSSAPGTRAHPGGQLLLLRLDHPVDGTADTATVSTRLSLPTPSACPGTSETEGIDATAGRLLVAVAQPGPCRQWTRLYTYTPSQQATPSRPAQPITP